MVQRRALLGPLLFKTYIWRNRIIKDSRKIDIHETLDAVNYKIKPSGSDVLTEGSVNRCRLTLVHQSGKQEVCFEGVLTSGITYLYGVEAGRRFIANGG